MKVTEKDTQPQLSSSTCMHTHKHMHLCTHLCTHAFKCTHLHAYHTHTLTYIYTSQKERDRHTDRDGEADTGTRTQTETFQYEVKHSFNQICKVCYFLILIAKKERKLKKKITDCKLPSSSFSWIGLVLIPESGEFTTSVGNYSNRMKYLNWFQVASLEDGTGICAWDSE